MTNCRNNFTFTF